MKNLNYTVETDTETFEFPISLTGLERAKALAKEHCTDVEVKQENSDGFITFAEVWNFNDYIIAG
jgi:hypothetical protein